MAASDEVRVVAGTYMTTTGGFFLGRSVRPDDEVPALLVIDSGLTAEQMRAALRDHEAIRAKLQAVRDWLKYAANSDGGMVAEIDHLLAATDTGGDDG